jgi:hypothetical protein
LRRRSPSSQGRWTGSSLPEAGSWKLEARTHLSLIFRATSKILPLQMLDLDLKQLISGLPVSPYIRTGATTGRSPLRWPARQRLLPSDTVSCNEMPAGWNELMPYGLFAAAKPRICRFKLRTGISKATEISANDKCQHYGSLRPARGQPLPCPQAAKLPRDRTHRRPVGGISDVKGNRGLRA